MRISDWSSDVCSSDLLGPAAFSGGIATAALGAFIYGHLMWGVVPLHHAIAGRRPVLLRRPVICGSIYGAVAYFGIFTGLAPLMPGKPANLGAPALIMPTSHTRCVGRGDGSQGKT